MSIDDGLPIGQEGSGMLVQGEGGFYEELLNGLDDGVYFVDPMRRITFWNQGAERITGYKAEDVVGSACADNILMHVDDKGNCLCTSGCPLASTMKTGNYKSVNIFLHHKDGHRVPVNVRASAVRDTTGRIIGGVETFRDGSLQQADLHRIHELEQLVFLDSLTGIANRRYLDNTLNSRFAQAGDYHGRFGLIMLDVDHFKRFNDEYGHETGDQVLQMVASTLSHNCRSFDTVGRWGGEEFLIVVGRSKGEEIQKLAEILRTLVETSSLTAHGQALSVTASFGVTVVRPGDDAISLTARVDGLLYQSKESGRNLVTFEG